MSSSKSLPVLIGPAEPRGLSHEVRAKAPPVYLLPMGRVRDGCLESDRVAVLSRTKLGTHKVAASANDLENWVGAKGAADYAVVGEIWARLRAPLPGFAGMTGPKPLIMGVVNVTPDSFSDGGDFLDVEAAIAHGLRLIDEGADILDVGGESTRPGAAPVTVETETARVIPVIEGLKAKGAVVSLDSRNAAVMQAALTAGVDIINDVSALTHDPAALDLVAKSSAHVVLMHKLGNPGAMQRAPEYDDVLLDIYDYLANRIAQCEAAGIARTRIAVDPGIGFGKTDAHNTALIDGLALFAGLGCPIVLGASRKSMIGRIAGVAQAKDRLPGSLAVAVAGADRGAGVLRVHDVAETKQAISLWRAVNG